MPDTFEWPKPEEPADEILLRNVRERGCHIVGVSGDDRAPAFVFSIGLFANYEHPEIILFGLEPNKSAAIVNIIRDEAAAGKRYADGDVSSDIVENGKLAFAEVPLDHYQNYLGTAIWFYRKSPRPFPCLQLVWTDDNDLFPWETGFDENIRMYQPILKSLS